MKKYGKCVLILTVLFTLLETADLIRDKAILRHNLIRMHVVANSNSDADQAVKLQVRDAVTSYIQPLITNAVDQEEAKAILLHNVDGITKAANEVLRQAGSDDHAQVSLAREEFDTRYYDTFTLPAGVYDALRIEIGKAAGKNWWCVVFPGLCMEATSAHYQDTAAGAGFDDDLISTLGGEGDYEIRFYLLDCLGKIENFFCNL